METANTETKQAKMDAEFIRVLMKSRNLRDAVAKYTATHGADAVTVENGVITVNR